MRVKYNVYLIPSHAYTLATMAAMRYTNNLCFQLWLEIIWYMKQKYYRFVVSVQATNIIF